MTNGNRTCFALAAGNHFAETCTNQGLEVAQEWDKADNITTVVKDRARIIKTAARILPYEHMCRAHYTEGNHSRFP